MKNIRVLFLLVSLLGLTACQHSPESANASTQVGSHAASYVTLEPNLQKLKADFNAHPESVRLVYIVGATCPECLHGMDVLGKVLHGENSNPLVRTYVVYVPALGAKAKDIQPTAELITGNYVSRYWDPQGASGRDFEAALGIKQFAWDVYMVYAPGQIWNAAFPPKPDFWMDQLDGLPSERCLNADVFAGHVKRALAFAKPDTSVQRGL